ncbi:MAG: NAD(P)-binding domain-containing protein [Tannerella sp.]|jgi:glutamyl-tRNA reductase|nr:NAD(P)-binding domain-containing protein [Tannerella sp.]
MINCRLINNAEYNLEDREILSSFIYINETIPHVLLKTCNRTELYWGEGHVPEDIIRHIYRVAAGLESSLIGEKAIQGQIKNAYMEAVTRYKLSSSLNRMFQTAIYTGKRIRTETGIAEGAVSHSQVTADILKQRGIDLKNKIIGIIGINKLTEDILKYLSAREAVNILLSNRNMEKAQDMAAKYNATAMSLENKVSIIEFSDVLICATSAPHTLIQAKDIPDDKEILIVDLAFPRDVDDDVRSIKGVDLLNLGDIERFAKKNISLRKNEIYKAEQIIEEEIGKFYHWLSYAAKVAVK